MENGLTYNKLSEVDRDLCDTPLNLAELGAAVELLKMIHLQGQMELQQDFRKINVLANVEIASI